MGKIKNFCGKWFDGEFWAMILFLVMMAAVSIGIQSLLVWVGGLFPSVEDCGRTIDAVLCALLILPIFIGVGLGSNFNGSWNILLALLAIIGIYICVVFWFNWFLFGGCLILLLFNLIRLDRIGCESLWIYGGVCAYLTYCIGAYFAVVFNGIEPAVGICGITILSLVTLGVWLKPALE